jgi:hypothetical protein
MAADIKSGILTAKLYFLAEKYDFAASKTSNSVWEKIIKILRRHSFLCWGIVKALICQERSLISFIVWVPMQGSHSYIVHYACSQ